MFAVEELPKMKNDFSKCQRHVQNSDMPCSLNGTLGNRFRQNSELLKLRHKPQDGKTPSQPGECIMNWYGLSESKPQNRMKNLVNEKGMPYRLFDMFRRPLTDEEGYPLRDIRGESLIIFDECNKPYRTISGSAIFDADGFEQNCSYHDPTKSPVASSLKKPFRNCKGREVLVFDKRGYPLTRMDAVPLTSARGKIMMTWKNDQLLDTFNEPTIKILKEFYQVDQIQRIRDSCGNPARLFDILGKPLTSSFGEPLTNAEGVILIKFDLQGFPETDWKGNPFFDENGLTIGMKRFNPCSRLERKQEMRPVLEWGGCRATLYDGSGMPLTDRRGLPLLTARGVPMVIVDKKNDPISDYMGRQLFDANALPLVKSLDRPILGSHGLPARLFDLNGTPLTDRHGFCLRYVNGDFVIQIDKIGRIKSTLKGWQIYDSRSIPSSNVLEFNPYQPPLDEIQSLPIALMGQRPISLYNHNGYPLTDNSGRALVNWKGNPLISVNSKENELIDQRGNPVYDIKGSLYYYKKQEAKEKIILYDCNGRPLTDLRGNILTSRLGISLVLLDDQGKPVSDLFLGKLYNSKGEIYDGTNEKEVQHNLRRRKKYIYKSKLQLFDNSDLPLLDKSGAMLFTRQGEPLIKINRDGNPISDLNGGPIFDENGVPVTKNDLGAWVDRRGNPLRLFDEEKRPLTDDKGKVLTDIWGADLIRLDEFGRPVMDKYGRLVFDAAGIPITSYQFNGSLKPRIDTKNMVNQVKCQRKLFDQEGRPLTDGSGAPLHNAEGLPSVRWRPDGRVGGGWSGGRVYDERRLPLWSNAGEPMVSVGVGGRPIRLFDSEGHPATGLDGAALRLADGRPAVGFDELGLPATASDGGPLLDSAGRPLGHPLFAPEGDPEPEPVHLLGPDAAPLRLFNRQGKPITDSNGYLLYNRQRDRVVYKEGQPLNGATNIYDEFGNVALLRINGHKEVLIAYDKGIKTP